MSPNRRLSGSAGLHEALYTQHHDADSHPHFADLSIGRSRSFVTLLILPALLATARIEIRHELWRRASVRIGARRHFLPESRPAATAPRTKRCEANPNSPAGGLPGPPRQPPYPIQPVPLAPAASPKIKTRRSNPFPQPDTPWLAPPSAPSDRPNHPSPSFTPRPPHPPEARSAHRIYNGCGRLMNWNSEPA